MFDPLPLVLQWVYCVPMFWSELYAPFVDGTHALQVRIDTPQVAARPLEVRNINNNMMVVEKAD